MFKSCLCTNIIKKYFVLIFVFFINTLYSQVTFTEIMYDPATSEAHDEFVEIYNLSTDTVDLAKWQLSDGVSPDLITDAGNGLRLAGGQFAVIHDGSYFGNSTTYDAVIPESALIVTIDDNGFGSNGLTNSSPKTLTLIDSSGNTIDLYTYQIGFTPGFSNEKVILSTDNSTANWKQALVKGGTPGAQNSVTPFSIDPGFDGNVISWVPNSGLTNATSITFNVVLFNFGTSDFTDESTVTFFIDNDHNGTFSTGDVTIFSQSGELNISASDSVIFEFNYQFELAGLFDLVALVESATDENPANNLAQSSILILDASNSIHLNEIKFLANTNEPEWIEFYNSGTKPFSFQGWGISDLNDTTWIDSSVIIYPGQYKVFAEGPGLEAIYSIEDSLIIILSQLPSLNNSGDEISIVNPLGELYERVPYELDWLQGEDSRKPSLERIDAEQSSELKENWGPSIATLNATPGYKNSLTPFSFDIGFHENAISWIPKDLITDETDITFTVEISNLGTEDFTGTTAFSFFIDYDNNAIFSSGDVLIDSENINLQVAVDGSVNRQINYRFDSPGFYKVVAILESDNDENPLNDFTAANVQVLDASPSIHINEIKFLANTGEPEWIEIYNSGTKPFSIQGWGISDPNDTTWIDSSVTIYPDQYKVFAEGSGLDHIYNINDSLIILLPQLPTLNNSGDVISLLNPLGGLYERVPYDIDWLQGEDSRKPSLERINIDVGTDLSSNWGPSTDALDATPGKRNSIAPFPKDIGFRKNAITFTPQDRITNDIDVKFRVVISNPGTTDFSGSADFSFFIDNNADTIFTETDVLLHSENLNLQMAPGDSLLMEFSHRFENAGQYTLAALVHASGDENPLNDFLFSNIQVLDASQSIHINEIKFLTFEGEPEWLELYNSGEKPVSLQSWGISDTRDTTWIDSSVYIYPDQYKIITADSGLDTLYALEDSLIIVQDRFPTLNNTEDIISLLSPDGSVLELVPYNIDWLEGEDWKNPSLERINITLDAQLKRNWGPSTSAQNATPGEKNSIYTDTNKELKSSLSISPNPFSPDGDGFEDHAVISLNLPVNSAQIKVEIYDIMGRKINTITDNTFSGSTSSLIWDGKDHSGRKVRMGIYIIFAQILNDVDGVIKEMKDTVVVAGQL